MAELDVDIVAVEREIWSGKATFVFTRTTSGEIGILPRHIPLVAQLVDDAMVRVEREGEEDLRIAVDAATLGLPQVRDASIPVAGGVQLLLRAIPAAHAMKIALTGESVSAQEALRIGLVIELLPRQRLLPAALDLAERIAANGPLAVQSIKRLALQTAHLTPREFASQAHLHWGLLRDSEDHAEGRMALAEQRPPKYTGT